MLCFCGQQVCTSESVLHVIGVSAFPWQQTEHSPIAQCRHDTDINNDIHIGIRHVILAKHWMWLPDDGFM